MTNIHADRRPVDLTPLSDLARDPVFAALVADVLAQLRGHDDDASRTLAASLDSMLDAALDVRLRLTPEVHNDGGDDARPTAH